MAIPCGKSTETLLPAKVFRGASMEFFNVSPARKVQNQCKDSTISQFYAPTRRDASWPLSMPSALLGAVGSRSLQRGMEGQRLWGTLRYSRLGCSVVRYQSTARMQVCTLPCIAFGFRFIILGAAIALGRYFLRSAFLRWCLTIFTFGWGQYFPSAIFAKGLCPRLTSHG